MGKCIYLRPIASAFLQLVGSRLVSNISVIIRSERLLAEIRIGLDRFGMLPCRARECLRYRKGLESYRTLFIFLPENGSYLILLNNKFLYLVIFFYLPGIKLNVQNPIFEAGFCRVYINVFTKRKHPRHLPS
jgi:hypothetical protein